MHPLQHVIETAFERRQQLSPMSTEPQLREAIANVLNKLDCGELRVAEKMAGEWVTHQWLKKAVLLSFRLQANQTIPAGFTNFYDKIPLKYAQQRDSELETHGTRVVPGAIVRQGAYTAKNVVLMPSFTNIGAYIDEHTMVDTWATVGSCAQIGKHVHLSGGVGIGGVLEPLQANPTIIEDNCFIGARSEIVEGVIVERGSVIAMGVYLSQSTRIYNRMTGEITYGRIPAGSVVVPGSLPSNDGLYNLAAAIIVKQVDAKTREKTNLNELLREVE